MWTFPCSSTSRSGASAASQLKKLISSSAPRRRKKKKPLSSAASGSLISYKELSAFRLSSESCCYVKLLRATWSHVKERGEAESHRLANQTFYRVFTSSCTVQCNQKGSCDEQKEREVLTRTLFMVCENLLSSLARSTLKIRYFLLFSLARTELSLVHWQHMRNLFCKAPAVGWYVTPTIVRLYKRHNNWLLSLVIPSSGSLFGNIRFLTPF